VVPVPDGGVGTPDGNTAACNPVAGTGCEQGEKCTWIRDTESLGHTGCVADGSVAAGGACTWPETYPSADNCVKGQLCINGACEEVCNYVGTDTCPTDFTCGPWSSFFTDVDGVGTCTPMCDPVTQDCPGEDACYLQMLEIGQCATVYPDCTENTQGVECCTNSSGDCFLNSCAKGYQAILTDQLCRFHCAPVENWLNNVTSLVGDADGVNCNSQFTDRPNGPGPSYECIFLNSIAQDTEVSSGFGMCVNPADDWGTCADFDLDGLTAAILAGTTIDEAYCTANPNQCNYYCVDWNTIDAIGTKSKNPEAFKNFAKSRIQKLRMDLLGEYMVSEAE